jgi:hypothetical protein
MRRSRNAGDSQGKMMRQEVGRAAGRGLRGRKKERKGERKEERA